MPPSSPTLRLTLIGLAAAGIAFIGGPGCSQRTPDHAAAGKAAGDKATAAVSRDTSGAATPFGYEPTVLAIGADAIRERVRSRGQVTLVNLWATWCPPCRAEMPELLRVARAHREDGVRLMLVSVDFEDQVGAVRKFLVSQAVAETSYIKQGDDMSFINALHSRWSGALPATLVFDRNGRLTDFWEGAANEDRFEHAVIAALAVAPQPETRP